MYDRNGNDLPGGLHASGKQDLTEYVFQNQGPMLPLDREPTHVAIHKKNRILFLLLTI